MQSVSSFVPRSPASSDPPLPLRSPGVSIQSGGANVNSNGQESRRVDGCTSKQTEALRRVYQFRISALDFDFEEEAMKTVAAAALALVIGASAFGGAKTDPGLDKLAKDFAAAFNQKDAARIAGFY